MAITGLVARKWYPGLIPATGIHSGFPGARISDTRQFAPLYHTLGNLAASVGEVEDEVLDFEDIDNFHALLTFRPKRGTLRVFENVGEAGQEFEILGDDASFSGPGSYECKWVHGTARLIFSSDQVNTSTTVYATYEAMDSPVGEALEFALLHQEMRAIEDYLLDTVVVSLSGDVTDSAIAAEDLEDEWAWMDDSGQLAAFETADLQILPRVKRAVYIVGAVGTGNAATWKVRGEIAVPAGLVATMPRGADLRVGRNGQWTWDQDATNGLGSGDWIRSCGYRKSNANTIVVDLTAPVRERKG